VSLTTEPGPAPGADAQAVLAGLEDARERTLALVGHLDDEQLERPHSPIMSPLVWDLAHIAAYEDLWLAHRLAGLELLRGDLADRYDAFETPRALRAEIPLLDTREARAYMEAVRARVTEALAERGVGDGLVCEMVVRHELQHTETMRQTLAIAGLLPEGEPALVEMQGAPAWRELPAGPFAMGADGSGFAYDNERPRHPVEVPAFRIARLPVSNESWLRFGEDGGYERREWWTEEGWAWKREQQISLHPSIAAGPPQAPACHVSFFEAEAFAQAHDARLPSEAEWERAARTADEEDPQNGTAGGRGPLDAVGQVWEWTASAFRGYPGFRAHPYREYSEVFFGEDYRVLRGGSWATAPRVASVTFRNWDLPQRRQIFAGVRLARNSA
jgi:iron(II)-dependent oxidoreductase